MIPTVIISFLVIAITLKSFSKAFLIFKLVKKGLINPGKKDLRKINQMLVDKKHYPLFRLIFKEILFIKIKIYLIRSVKKDEFICRVNFVISRLYQYSLNQDKLTKRIGKILNRYDSVLQKKIYDYKSPIQGPIVKILRNINQIRGYNRNLMIQSFFAVKDMLLTLIGEPLVNNKLAGYRMQVDAFDELKGYFDDKQIAFLNHLKEINFAA